jgi:hypothetical protein
MPSAAAIWTNSLSNGTVLTLLIASAQGTIFGSGGYARPIISRKRNFLGGDDRRNWASAVVNDHVESRPVPDTTLTPGNVAASYVSGRKHESQRLDAVGMNASRRGIPCCQGKQPGISHKHPLRV